MVGPSGPGSVGEVIAEVGRAPFAVDLRQTPPKGPTADWLAGFPPTHFYGTNYVPSPPMSMPMDLRDMYDVLLCFDDTTAATPTATTPLGFFAGQECMNPSAPTLDQFTNLDLAAGDLTGSCLLPDTVEERYRVFVRPGRGVVVERQSAPWTWGRSGIQQRVDASPYRGRELVVSAIVEAAVSRLGDAAVLFRSRTGHPASGVHVRHHDPSHGVQGLGCA